MIDNDNENGEPHLESCNVDELVACLRSKDDDKKWESSFDELVRIFHKGIYPSDCFRPFPPMLGNGHCVDLWKLYSVVNQKGGFESVSEKGLWGEVCELSQLSPRFGPALKLVYLKYLELVECLLSKLRSGVVSEEEELMELETDFSRFVSRMEFVDLTKENGEKRKLRRKSGCKKSVIDVELEVVDLSGQNFDDGKLKRKKIDMNFGNDGVLSEVGIIDGKIKTKRKKSKVAYVIDEYLCPESDSDGKLEKKRIGLSLSDDTSPGLLDDRGSSDGAEVGDNLVTSLESLGTSKKGSPKIKNVAIGGAGVLKEDFVSRKSGLDSGSVTKHENGCSESDESQTSSAETDSPVVSEAEGSSEDAEVAKSLVKCSTNAETKVMNVNTLELRKDISCRDMKQDSLLGMLQWMADVSKNPTDPAIGEIPENSKWAQYGSDHCWKQVLLARQVLFLKKEQVPQNDQKKPKMHPSMFDDQIEALDRPRYHAGLLSPKNPSNTYTLPDLNSNRGRFRQRLLTRLDLQPKASIYTCRPQQRIPVGGDYQADLPEWTGLPSDDDTKWLGTRVWPLERRENKSVVEREPIGKGRGDTCGCQFRDSPSCVKFHVYEKAKKMELILGSAFYAWDFHTMGEGCNLSWTALEERQFKNVVKENPAKEDKNFWHQIGQVLPQKTWAELVTYYFNVFKLRRRGSQNRLKRLLPRCELNVDSDDDETEYAISY